MVRVYIKKNFRIFWNSCQIWKMLASTVIIILLVCFVVCKKMFGYYDNTKSGFFAIMSAAIWIGLFNSIESICSEHNTIESECMIGAHIRCYVLGQVVFQIIICLVQTLLLILVFWLFVDFGWKSADLSETGISLPALAEYGISFFLIMFGSDVMGIMLSSIMPNTKTAMIVMPIVLLMQLILCGVLFDLNGPAEYLSWVTFSKWGMSALGSIAHLNELKPSISATFPEIQNVNANDAYTASESNLLKAYAMLFILSVVCICIAGARLYRHNRRYIKKGGASKQ